MKFGDLVEYDLHVSRGGNIERAYVLGEMIYSSEIVDGARIPTHVLLGNPCQLSMPINSSHCRVISSGHESVAQPLREQYLTRFPGRLKPLG